MNKLINIIGLYRSPSGSVKQFYEFINNTNINFNNTIIMGDFNIDLIKTTYKSKLMSNSFIDNCLKQLVKSPTRITTTSSTLIDYCLISKYNKSKYKLKNEDKYVFSEHSALCFEYYIDKVIKKTNRSK